MILELKLVIDVLIIEFDIFFNFVSKRELRVNYMLGLRLSVGG